MRRRTDTFILLAFLVAAYGLTSCSDSDESDGIGGSDPGGDPAGDTTTDTPADPGGELAGDTLADPGGGDPGGGDPGGEPAEETLADPGGGDPGGEPGAEPTGDVAADPGGEQAADTAPTRFDLAFSGTGFTPHVGQLLKVAVLEQPGDAIVQTDQATVGADGSFAFTWPDLLEEGKAYEIAYFADLSGNGACDTPPTDHGWSEDVPAVAADLLVDVQHNTNFAPDVCTYFP